MRRTRGLTPGLALLLACCLGGAGLCLALVLEPDRTPRPPIDLSGLERQEPAVVAALRANGARILSLGKRGGLDGHFVEPAGGDAYSLYLTPDGHAVAGLLYEPDGTLLTGRQLEHARIGRGSGVETYEDERVPPGETAYLAELVGAPAAPGGADAGSGNGSDAAAFLLAHADGAEPQAPDKAIPWYAEALFARSHSAFGFSLGQSGPAAVVFADPACRWSRAAVTRLARAALDGRLRLRVIPVGVLGAASAREAAVIASAADPALAWFEGADGSAGPEGGRRIASNNALFDDWGVDAVPLIAWRARDGRVAHRVGEIDDIDAWLGGLSDE